MTFFLPSCLSFECHLYILNYIWVVQIYAFSVDTVWWWKVGIFFYSEIMLGVQGKDRSTQKLTFNLKVVLLISFKDILSICIKIASLTFCSIIVVLDTV